ncbi:MAG: substrate-binding domain-containing protein [Acidimicrobiales bacterium]
MSLANSAEAHPTRRVRRCTSAASIVVASCLALLWSAIPAAASPNMQSTGSSFASVAIQSWVGQTATLFGLNINWQVQSSVVGLNTFAQNQVDFAASDIPYSSQQSTYYPNDPYQYMPDVAGGLAFMYNLTGNDGQRITSLQLNPHVLDEIFLGEISSWNSPDIAKLNPQLAGDLPSGRIIPVYRSDASGENYLLSDYMLHQDNSNFVSAQTAFHLDVVGQPSASWPIPTPGYPVSSQTYPGWASGNPVPQNGSDNAANYVSAVSSEGSITYVETAYAKEHAFPVVSMINASGHAVQPTSLNVATALEAAILHADLTQDLTNVYTNPLPNAYPLSAYSYFVTPCSPQLAGAQSPPTTCAADPGNAASTFPSAKGQALGVFIGYVACAGQQAMADLGYSPLPPNLVQEDFDAIGRLNGGQQPPPVSAATCKNPYVDGQIALPGEPAIIGQNPNQPGAVTSTLAAGAAGGGAAGASARGAGGSGKGGGASSGSGSSGSGSASGGAGGEAGAAGEAVPLGASGQNKYLRADALVAASRQVAGAPVLELLGWLLFAALIVLAPPLIAQARRRRSAPVGDGPDERTT